MEAGIARLTFFTSKRRRLAARAFALVLLVPVGLVVWSHPVLSLVTIYALIAVALVGWASFKALTFGATSRSEFLVLVGSSGNWDLVRVRSHVASLLRWVAMAITWPTYIIVGVFCELLKPGSLKSRSVQHYSVYYEAQLALGIAWEVWEAIYLVLILCCGVGISYAALPFQWLSHVAVAVFSLPCLRLAAFAISGRTMAERSKSWEHPYLSSLALSALYATLLSVGWPAIFAWHDGRRISVTDVLETFQRLTTAVPLRELASHPPRTAGSIVFTACALLCYASLAKIVLRRKDFVRDDNDWLNIASREIVLGHYQEALAATFQVKRSTAHSAVLQGLALTGLSRFDDALKVAEAGANSNLTRKYWT